MKRVSKKEWELKAAGLAEWRKKRTSPPKLDVYKKIVSMVHVGKSVLDVGCGQCHLKECLPTNVFYQGIDPFPICDNSERESAEALTKWVSKKDSVFMLAALDNVLDLNKSLLGLKNVARENIVIFTGIGIPPDENHTIQIDREDLVNVLGEPTLQVQFGVKLFLFEWKL